MIIHEFYYTGIVQMDTKPSNIGFKVQNGINLNQIENLNHIEYENFTCFNFDFGSCNYEGIEEKGKRSKFPANIGVEVITLAGNPGRIEIFQETFTPTGGR